MTGPNGIIIFGPNGSGKTTLGRELSRLINFKHIDNMDYAHKKSDITYANKLSREERVKLYLVDIEEHRNFVITAVTGDFGEIFQNIISWLYTSLHLLNFVLANKAARSS